MKNGVPLVIFYGDIERIGKYAFAETPLKAVKFLGELDTIEECAFEGCSGKSDVRIFIWFIEYEKESGIYHICRAGNRILHK